MFNFLLKFFSKKPEYSLNKDYQRAYKKLWIDNIKNYSP